MGIPNKKGRYQFVGSNDRTKPPLSARKAKNRKISKLAKKSKKA